MYQLGISKSSQTNKISAFTQAEDLNSHGGGPIIYNTAIDKLFEFMMAKQTKCQHKKSIFPAQSKIIAIGDIHGDFHALRYSLLLAKVITEIPIHQANYNSPFDGTKYYRWSGRKTFLIQLGDLLDRGGRGVSTRPEHEMEEIQVLKFLYDLSIEASKTGGKVITLIGNHELMNMLGDFRYASAEHIKGMGGYKKRKLLLQPGGDLANKMACFCYGLVKIGNWIFAHGGVLPQHVDKLTKVYSGYKYSSKISKTFFDRTNQLIHNILTGTVNVKNISPEEEYVLFGSNGIFWTREYGKGNQLSEEKCQLAYRTLEKLNNGKRVGGIVVGHTPQHQINSECNGHVIRVDTGMSEAFGNRTGSERVEVLEIVSKNGKETVKALSSVEQRILSVNNLLD